MRFAECQLTYLGWNGRSAKDADSAWRQLGRVEKSDTTHMLDATRGYRRMMVAAVLARSGMADSARAVLRAATRREPGDSAAPTATLAEAYVRVLLNDHDGALRALTDWLRVQPDDRPFVRAHSWFRPLRNDPRFVALVN